MSFLTNIFRGASREKNSSDIVPVTSAGIDLTTSSRVQVDELSAFAVATYHRCVELIAQQVAIMPLRYMGYDSKLGIMVEREGEDYHYLLTVQPNQYQSAYQFRYQMIKNVVHNGEAFVYPRKALDGRVSELVLLQPLSTTLSELNHIYTITDTVNGVYGNFEESEVIHLIWNSPDGYHGDAAWWLSSVVLNIAATGDKETQKRFESGGNVSGIVGNNVQSSSSVGGGQYSSSTLKDVAKDIERAFANGSKIVSVPGDAKFSPFTSSSADMQMTEQQKRVTLEICRHLGVQPYMLGVESSGTQYNTPEVAQKAFLSQTIEPMLQMVECEFQRKLIPRNYCHKRMFRYDREQVFSLDLKSMAEYISKTIANGTHTINDWRKKLNQPLIDGGDEALVTANLMTIDALKAKGMDTSVIDSASEDGQKKEITTMKRDARGRFVKKSKKDGEE